GGIDSLEHSNISILDNTLTDAHGAIVMLRGDNLKILRNDMSRGGQLGVGLARAADSLVQGNRIHDNNTDDFAPAWEAGGLKSTRTTRLSIDHNEVYLNRGHGLWCDIDCQTVTFSDNRVHDNDNDGIKYEISRGARIYGNTVWNNGWAPPHGWGWGA